MNELDFVKLYNLRISPKTGLPTKDQKVEYTCFICNKLDKKEWYSLYNNYILLNKPFTCKSCMLKLRITDYNKSVIGLTPEERFGEEKGKLFREKMSKATSGENNPRFGVEVAKETREKMSKAQKGKTLEEKCGKEKALEIKKRLSIANSGENNPMFGKPPPQGGGNGWSGWFKDFYFRSLLELSFLIEHQNVKSAENIKIPYTDFNGIKKNYLPDFTDGLILYEIKPSRLVDSKENQLKFEAAKKYCEQNNLIFKIITELDINELDNSKIKELRENGVIKFIDRYEQKFKEKYEKRR